MSLRVVLSILLFSWIVSSCNQSSPSEEEGEVLLSDEKITLTKEQVKQSGIETGSVVERRMSQVAQANGMVDVPPQYKASVSAIMGGFIQSTKVLEGDRVKKGEVLAVLSHPDYIELQQQYLEAKSKTDFLSKDLERQKILREENINSKKEFEKTESELKTGQAQLNALRARLEMVGLNPEKVAGGEIVSSVTVRSPIAGVVTAVNTSLGKSVGPEQVLFEVVSLEHIHLDLKVYEKDAAKIKEGQQVLVKRSSEAEEEKATVVLVGKSMDMQNRTISVHAHPEQKQKNWIPGMYVKGRIMIEERLVKALPEEAIIKEGGKNYIYITSDSAAGKILFERKEIQIGMVQDGYVEVYLPDTIDGNIVKKGTYHLFASTRKPEEG